MAKIYSSPSSVEIPSLKLIDNASVQAYNKACDEFKEKLKAFLEKRNPNGKNVGEVISFPVADSSAEYMVASMKPVELIHLPLWDAWEFQYVSRLTAKDVQQKIDSTKALNKLFSKK